MQISYIRNFPYDPPDASPSALRNISSKTEVGHGKTVTATQANNPNRTECGASDGPASLTLFSFSQSSAFPFHRKKPTG